MCCFFIFIPCRYSKYCIFAGNFILLSLKNVNKKVLLLTLSCTAIYFAISVVMQVSGLSWEPFDRVNLVSEVFTSSEDDSKNANSLQNKKDSLLAIQEANHSKEDFKLYEKPNLITNFQAGEVTALPSLMEKLQRLKKGEKVKIRIAYLGDSMIEGDLMTQTLRLLLQKEYGGSGVGFLPISSNVAGFRQTASISAKGWSDANFMTKNAKNLYISGYRYSGSGTGSYTDNTLGESTANIEKALIFGSGNEENISINGSSTTIYPSRKVNRMVFANDHSNRIKISVEGISTPLYGISFESESGVFVDNFSFRGITGVELNKLDEDFMQAIQEANPYDLIVLQYGVNLLFRPKDTDYSYYFKTFAPTVEKMKRAFKGAEFLLVGSADRAFKYNGQFKTAIGLPNLIESQALLAFQNKIAFYNQFQTMGGENSIVKWANETPPLANKDYIHPNHKGAEILAQKLFDALQKDYQKHTHRPNK